MKFTKTPTIGTGSQSLLKLADKQSIIGVFRGEPVEFYSKWVGQKSTICEASEEGARFRFRINFITKSPDLQYEALVWEQGPTVYNLLKSLNEDFPLDSTVMKITRFGSTKDNTNYTILPIPKGHEVTPQLNEVLSHVKLNDLTASLTKEPITEPTPLFAPDELSTDNFAF